MALAVAVLLAACGGGSTTGNGDPGTNPEGTDEDAQDEVALDVGKADLEHGPVFADLYEPPDVKDNGVIDWGYPPEDEGPPAQVCTTGSLKGITCAPNQQTTVAFAKVTLDVSGPCTEGKVIHLEVESDADGKYQFSDVPVGEGTLSFSKGSYHGQSSVAISPGQVTDLTGMAQRCFKTVGAAKLAVVKGDADKIEKLLDGLALSYDAFLSGDQNTVADSPAFDLLTDPVKLMQYDVLFINCTTAVQAMLEAGPEIPLYLRSFVAAGKSLYASDWAWIYVEKAFPEAIDFAGVDDSYQKGTSGEPDNKAGPRQGPGPTLAEKNQGVPPLAVQADFTDQALAAVMKKAATTIFFDLGTWVVANKGGTGTAVEVLGTIPESEGSWGQKPLVITFQPEGAKGHVVFTSFHNAAQGDQGFEDIQAILSYLVFSL